MSKSNPPDIAVESVLFHSYMREKQRADRLMEEVRQLRETIRRNRMLGMTHAMRKAFKPAHLDRPAKKGKF